MKGNGGNVLLELIMDDLHDRGVEGHADPQEVARCPISFSLLLTVLTPSVLPLRTIWFVN